MHCFCDCDCVWNGWCRFSRHNLCVLKEYGTGCAACKNHGTFQDHEYTGYSIGLWGSYEQRKQTRTTEQAKTNLYMKIHGIKYL